MTKITEESGKRPTYKQDTITEQGKIKIFFKIGNETRLLPLLFNIELKVFLGYAIRKEKGRRNTNRKEVK